MDAGVFMLLKREAAAGTKSDSPAFKLVLAASDCGFIEVADAGTAKEQTPPNRQRRKETVRKLLMGVLKILGHLMMHAIIFRDSGTNFTSKIYLRY
jgi:hypothetical protein